MSYQDIFNMARSSGIASPAPAKPAAPLVPQGAVEPLPMAPPTPEGQFLMASNNEGKTLDGLRQVVSNFLFGQGALKKAAGQESSAPQPPADRSQYDFVVKQARQQAEIERNRKNRSAGQAGQGAPASPKPANSKSTTPKASPAKPAAPKM